MSHGVHALLSYTVSKVTESIGYLNAQDDFGQLAKVLAGFDTPQRAILSGSWALPWFNNGRRIPHQVLGGWQLTGIITMQSGLPTGAPGGVYSTEVNPKIPDAQRSRQRWFNTCTLSVAGVRQNCASTSEPVAFTVQPPFTLRTLSVRFPNIRDLRPLNVDFSIFKRFPIAERVNMEFRLESFNLTNTPWFGGPNLTVGGANFGVVTPQQANDPRNVQLALRLSF
jgi:hypothetical protein